MNLYTLNVGQGNFAVLVGESEAIIIDVYMPAKHVPGTQNIKSILPNILRGKNLLGIILTGFDADHVTTRGMSWLLHRYWPSWIMYPSYRKDTSGITSVFEMIERLRKKRFGSTREIERISVRLDKRKKRTRSDLSQEWNFEIFSPHISDMTSSNNSSLVVKVIPKGWGGFSYLITGDTENDRWSSINRFFGHRLRAEVLAAPHHGARNGINSHTMSLIQSSHVLVSAGQKYGHPHDEALDIFEDHNAKIFVTSELGTLVTYKHWFWGLQTIPIIH